MNIGFEEFYSMDFDEFFLKLSGWTDARDHEEYLFMRVAYSIHCSLVSKPLSPDRFWPHKYNKPQKGSALPYGRRQLAELKRLKDAEL